MSKIKLIVIPIAGILIIELTVRILCWIIGRPGYTVYEFIRDYPRYTWSQYTRPTLAREEKAYKFYGDKILINKHGFRGRYLPPDKTKDTKRIIVLGGSQAFDLKAPEGKDWPHEVEKILQSEGHKVEVLNAAVPGQASWDSLGKMYAELYMWQPDVVIFDEEWNDIKYFHNLSPKLSLMARSFYGVRDQSGDASHPESRIHLLDRFLGWSWAYTKVRIKYYHLRSFLEGKPAKTSREGLLNQFSEWGPKQYALNLDLLYHLCEHINAKFVLIKQPRLVAENNSEQDRRRISYQMAGLDHSTLVRAFKACDQVINDLGARYPDILVIDPTVIMNGQSIFFDDHVHTTEIGSEKLATIVSAEISNYLSASLAKTEEDI